MIAILAALQIATMTLVKTQSYVGTQPGYWVCQVIDNAGHTVGAPMVDTSNGAHPNCTAPDLPAGSYTWRVSRVGKTADGREVTLGQTSTRFTVTQK